MEKELTELEILKFWKDKKIYEKSKKKNSRGKKFYLMDGPPYATGHIHMGTALNKILKDIAMRSQRLQGKDVFDRAGYDTHGVPIEFQIETEIGSKSKQDIEKYGVKKFIKKCKDFATKYIGVMNKEFLNLGAWFDFSSPYLTLSPEYIETIWDTFKEADKKKLLYLGKYPVHVCPRCATAVAYNEIEYSRQEDTSVFIKFPLKNKPNTFLIIWTTTPWTLPANTGVMVHPEFVYSEIVVEGEKWIVAKEIVHKIMAQLGHSYKEKTEIKGKDMKNWEYENPLSKNLKLKLKNSCKVVLSSRYVNLEEGTGLVHSAPGHGKEDYEVGKESGLDIISPVDITGSMTEEAGKYAGKKARVVDAEIIDDLEKDKMLIHKIPYTHDYPLCWRCKSPLLTIALPQWFLKISSIQKKLLSENDKTNWIPDWMKLRMKAWMEGIGDWPVSRMRYWGTPLPIWICDKCNKKIVIGSRAELEKLSGKKVKELHKPEIDEVKIPCFCRGKMKRVPEVLDVWFDSGVSSWAALNEKERKKYWPADLNLEGKDQIRGWWNSEFILSEIKFGKKPMDSICVHGMVLDLGKRKMSKSLGNIVSPQDIIDNYGRDYMRYYFARVSKGEDFALDEEDFLENQKVFRVLLNVNNFVNQLEKCSGKVEIEDKWILSRYNSIVKEAIRDYNSYKFPEAISLIENFLVNDLSKTYIQIIRERSNECLKILDEIRLGLLKLLAPIIPFATERIWQELREKKAVKEESIHLTEFPKCEEKKINKKLEEEFLVVLKIIEIGLRERDIAHIGLKWPLASAKIFTNKKIDKNIFEIIARQLNVKKLELVAGKSKEIMIELDLNMTPELEIEGYAREISRAVQAERKKAGLVKGDRISLAIATSSDFISNLKRQEDFIKERTGSKKIEIIAFSDDKKKKFKNPSKLKIKDRDFEIYFEKV